MKIEIKKSKKEDMEKEGVMSWPIWEKKASRFDWHYDTIEECYLLEGKVRWTPLSRPLLVEVKVYENCIVVAHG